MGKLSQTVLADAMTDAGKIDAEHGLVREWLATHNVYELPGVGAIPTPQAVKNAQTAKPKVSPRTRNNAPPATIQTRIGSHEIEDLENLTVREVMIRYGSIDGFKRFVESLKNIAEYKFREMRVQLQRGELIERDAVSGQIFPLIDVAFSRLVSDVPDTLSKLVVARVESGGPGTTKDVQQMIREANSRVLKNVKTSIEKTGLLSNA